MEYFIAFYMAGVALAMLKLFRPSYLLLKDVDPNNIVVQNIFVSSIVMTLSFMILLIPLTPALLSDSLRDSFCVSFCDAVLNKG
jgi:hypothetical protein|tara:strand:+ start:669 stop:920 length:252 start_codon:yes stop_codon:yes gene_type:complete